MPGTYTSSGGTVVDMLDREVWLHSSNGPSVTFLDGENTRSGLKCDFQGDCDTLIEGFTIHHGLQPGGNGGGVHIRESNPTLKNCIITSNSTPYRGGGIHMYDAEPLITGCVISNNSASGKGGVYGGGISSIANSNPTITQSVICGNSPDQIDGTYTNGGGNYIDQTCPPLGACCVGDSCIDDLTLLECQDNLGLYASGQSCDGFECPATLLVDAGGTNDPTSGQFTSIQGAIDEPVLPQRHDDSDHARHLHRHR